ncbi:MAG: DUF542 domain-containing protein [Spirochaetaceae bacterium]|nr:DUF542 domain-containing protein [Spirochaetaceae bacterium]
MNNIDKTQTLGQIVAKHPYTVDVLNKYKIDFSFKGNTTLEEAIRKQNLLESDVISELDLAVDEFKLMKSKVIYWENEPIDKILDFIEGHHHKFMNNTMNEIKMLFLLDNSDSEQQNQLRQLFFSLQEEMEAHQKKEEQNLFTLLREYSSNRTKELRDRIVKYMIDTEDEHDSAGIIFKKINTLTNDFSLPEDASPRVVKIYELLNTLEKETFVHIHMENSILFKMI